jgi:hypothetical protein
MFRKVDRLFVPSMMQLIELASCEGLFRLIHELPHLVSTLSSGETVAIEIDHKFRIPQP